MKPCHLNRWIAWLLPLFVLRAFVPAGYMLAASPHGMQMVLCTGASAAAMPATAHAAAAEHGDHAAHGSVGNDRAHAGHAYHTPPSTEESSDHRHSAAEQSSICVFAAGGTANSPPPQMAVLLDTPSGALPIDFIANPELSSFPILIDRIRGPPRV